MPKRYLILTILMVVLSAPIFSQESDGQTAEAVAVEQIFLAKDNGEGKVGDVVENFLTTDIPVYCVVQLTSTRQTVVKMNLVAVSVPGVKAETKVITVSYKTNGRQNRVSFTGRPDGIWTAGTYRIDIYIDDKKSGAQTFEITKSPLETPEKIAPATRPVVPLKSKAKPRTARSTRKN